RCAGSTSRWCASGRSNGAGERQDAGKRSPAGWAIEAHDHQRPMTADARVQRAAFLDVEKSLTGRRWAARLGDERTALAMAQRYGLPDAICRLLAARDVGIDSVPDFLEPTLRKFLPDPSHLKDMDAAVDR